MINKETFLIKLSEEIFGKIFELVNDIGKKVCKGFILDVDNTEFYIQLIYYFFQDKSCIWDHDKGLYIHGKLGRGKDIAMRIFKEITGTNLRRNSFAIQNCISIANECASDGLGILKNYRNKPYLFSELANEGNENSMVNVYGMPTNVMENLLMQRYDLFQSSGVRTHITSNFKYDEIKKNYGLRLESRFKEMFNEIELTGIDRRC